MPKMPESRLRAIVSSAHADALAASNASKLSLARSDASAYYNGDMSKDLPSAAGRSSAVSMDVSDVIEGLMPQLMEVFCGSDEVVRFEPVGPDDVQSAEQETDYVNHVMMNVNAGFLVLYSFIKDALLHKVGVVKVWWEKETKIERETYYDKTDDEYALIVASPDIDIIEHSEKPAVPTNPGDDASPPQMLHDVTVETKKDHAYAKVMGVPGEEFGIERSARSIRECNYCFHKVVDRTETDLIELGYDKKQVKNLPSYRAWTNSEEINRDTVDENASAGSDEANSAARTVEITEHYIRLDYENDGKARLYRVVTGGNQGEILKRDGRPDIELFDAIPFAAITPIIVTHRFWGRSIADLVMDIQRIKTALIRSLLDNAYLANNRQKEVAESHASENTLDDLLVSRPGGIVRVKVPGGIRELEHTDVGTHVYPLLEYQDSTREWRTGVSKQSQGIDANALQNQTATATNQAYTASQARVRLIARIFAETGVKDLFWLLHSTIKKHGEQSAVVKLKNQWVTVDPRNWKTRNDLTVHVGLGSGGRAQRVAELNLLAGLQKEAMAAGLTNLVSVENLYSTAKEFVRALGMPNVDAFFTDPKTQPPPQHAPDPKLIELQAKNEIEKTQAQADIATQNTKTQAEIALQRDKFQLQKELAILEFRMQETRVQQAHDLEMSKINAKLHADREVHAHKIVESHVDMAHAAQAHHLKMKQAETSSHE